MFGVQQASRQQEVVSHNYLIMLDGTVVWDYCESDIETWREEMRDLTPEGKDDY